LAKDNNILVGGQLYADSIGDEDSPAPTYYDMLRYNTITIVGALKNNIVVSSENIGTDQENGSNKDFVLFVAIGVLFLGGFIIVYKKLNQ